LLFSSVKSAVITLVVEAGGYAVFIFLEYSTSPVVASKRTTESAATDGGFSAYVILVGKINKDKHRSRKQATGLMIVFRFHLII